MILSNNPKTYITITMYYYGGIISKKYIPRWAGPSSAHTPNLRTTLWNRNDIKNFKENL